jgi:hypothetical protein
MNLRVEVWLVDEDRREYPWMYGMAISTGSTVETLQKFWNFVVPPMLEKVAELEEIEPLRRSKP